MKKIILLSIAFIFSVVFLYSVNIDKTLYLKVPNRYGDFSYISQNELSGIGYKIQYIKLSIDRTRGEFYIFEPSYKFYSSDNFENFYYYSKMRMFHYNFMTYTVNLSKMNTDEFLFDTASLINGISKSPVLILQRLFLDKNFYDNDGNLIENPQDRIFIFLIDSSRFERLLPEGNYIKDFFICVYYNKDDLSDEQIVNSLVIDGYPLPIANYEKYSLFEDSVMKKLKKERELAKEAENKLYSSLSKDLKKIRKKQTEKISKKEIVSGISKKEIPIVNATKDTLISPRQKTNKKNKEFKRKIELKPKIPKKSKIIPKKKIVKPQKEENIPKRLIKRKISIFIKSEGKPEGGKLTLSISGEHLPKKKVFNFFPIRKSMSFEVELNNKSAIDTLKFKISKGFLINGVYSDSIYTTTCDLLKCNKIVLNLDKLPNFNLIFIDKSEILPIEWVGIEPIIKDLKKTLKKSKNFGIFYFDNEKIKGDFFENTNQNCENYIWEKIYPLATSSGIRMEHLYKLADKWLASDYSKQYIPTIHLFLSRATLKSLIAMDDWEMTKKKFKILKRKFGDCKIIIHAKIKKKDNIPIYKLGIPFKKIK